MIQKIISGGQTGVDRAALDVAIDLNIPCGGWCPRGRLAEDGVIDQKYQLQETASRKYPIRTEMNVLVSDATLILTRGKPDRGTGLTLRLAKLHNKPYWVINLDNNEIAPDKLWAEMDFKSIKELNIAGPRESSKEGIYKEAYGYLHQLFSQWKRSGNGL